MRSSLELIESRRLLTSITMYPVPSSDGIPQDIAVGPDGNLWFTVGPAGPIGMMNATTHVVTQFDLPGNYIIASGLTAGPDGNLWFTDISMTWNGTTEVRNGAIGMINLSTDAITEFPVPITNSVPNQITVGPDGNLWFTDINTNNIGMINPTTDAITEFPVPTAGVGPAEITVGPDGNLWFTESYASQIGVINPTTQVITEISAPGQLGGITAGPDGNLWFTGSNAEGGFIGSINLTTDAIATTPLTDPGAYAGEITLGPDGNLWFTSGTVQLGEQVTYSIGVMTPGGADTGDSSQATDGIGDLNSSGTSSQPGSPTAPAASITPGTPFGFTLTVDATSAGNDASSTGTITVSLADGPGGATLSVTTKQGTSTDSGLTLKKHDNSYRLVAGAGSHLTRVVNHSDVASTRPVLTEKILTAGKGKREHVVGVEVSISKVIARSLNADIASRPAGSAGERVGFQVDYGSSPGAAGEALVGKARLGHDGQVIVVAKT